MWQSLIPAAISAYGQYRSNKQTANYATDMSNTAYQRAMADMKSAGLNPILAGKLGGASTPNVQFGNIGSAAVQGYQQGAQAQASIASAKQAQAQTKLTDVERQLKERDLNFMQKRDLSYAELQSDFKKVFTNKTIQAITDGFENRVESQTGVYRAIAQRAREVLINSGSMNKGGQISLIDGLDAQFVVQIVQEIAKLQKNSAVNLGTETFDLIKELLNGN